MEDPYGYLMGAQWRVPWDYGGRRLADLGLRSQSIADIRASDPGSEWVDYGATESGGSNAPTFVGHPEGTDAYAWDDANGIRWNVDSNGYLIPGTNVSTRHNRDFQRLTQATILGMAGAAAAGAGGAAGAEAAGSASTGASGAGGAAGAGGGGAAGAAGGTGMSWFDWAQLASGAYQAHQAGRAQDAQVGAARDATALQERQFNQLREDQAPYRGAGYAALGDLMGMRGGPSMSPEDVMAEPGYEFGRLQGMRGVEGSAAARGMALSGSALKNAARFNSDYATTRYGDAWNRRQADFGNRWGRLSALAGIGQSATNMTNQAGMQFGNNAASNMMGAGNAQAAGAITRGNIYGNMINQGLSMYGRNRTPQAARWDDPYRNAGYYGGDEGE